MRKTNIKFAKTKEEKKKVELIKKWIDSGLLNKDNSHGIIDAEKELSEILMDEIGKAVKMQTKFKNTFY